LELNLFPSSYWPGAAVPTCAELAKVSGLALSFIIRAALERLLVTDTDLSASYCPGPAVVTILFSDLVPNLKDLTSELNRFPSSYWPGAAVPTCAALARVSGLALSLPMMADLVRHLMTDVDLSASYCPGPKVVSILFSDLVPIVKFLTS